MIGVGDKKGWYASNSITQNCNITRVLKLQTFVQLYHGHYWGINTTLSFLCSWHEFVRNTVWCQPKERLLLWNLHRSLCNNLSNKTLIIWQEYSTDFHPYLIFLNVGCDFGRDSSIVKMIEFTYAVLFHCYEFKSFHVIVCFSFYYR